MSEARAHMQALQQQTLRASHEVRRMSHGLHPSVIRDFGLSVALEDFCEEFQKAHGIIVDFEGSLKDEHLGSAEATCLYRIAQESMRNARVHGNASEVRVALQATDGQMQLQVQDNGSGSSADRLRNKTGLGIVSMKERIRMVNGTLHLSSKAGQGTTITALVPLSAPLSEDRHDES
jgi:two-component system sensor histidine kinase UhpB